MPAMSDIKAKAKRERLPIRRAPKLSNETPEPEPSDPGIDGAPPGPRILRRTIAVLITLASVAAAAAADGPAAGLRFRPAQPVGPGS